jgi:purine-binding chemotaxis protein CheW
MAKQLADSYLTFKIDNELFAINVSKVLEILEVKPVAKVPMSPPYMMGVINLRGNILPVIDTRNKLYMAQAPYTKDSCIIVVNIGSAINHLLVGALVDAVKEVIEIADEAIQPSSQIGVFCKDEFVTGVGKTGEQFVLIIDPNKVFVTDEMINHKTIH